MLPARAGLLCALVAQRRGWFPPGVPPLRRVLPLWLPVVVWLAVILSFSSDAASAQSTSRFLGPLIAWLFPHWDEPARAAAHLLIRKTAHVAEYALLAALLLRALRGTQCVERNHWRWSLAFAALAGCLAVACLDEFLQSRSATRTGSVWDVALDVGGATLAMVFAWRFARWQRRKQTGPP